MRIAVLDKELCRPKKCGHECQKFCPVNRKGDECIKISDKAVIDEGLCIGCSICVKKCPFKAISIVNLPEKLKENPVHRFGANGFALFRLPVPADGVLGLIGANGVGKTTALRILSGDLMPNLGKKTADWKEIMKIHRGTELQDYMDKLSRTEIKTAYKEQQVDQLAKDSRLVSEIIDDSEMIKKLELEGCLERKLSELSGGER